MNEVKIRWVVSLLPLSSCRMVATGCCDPSKGIRQMSLKSVISLLLLLVVGCSDQGSQPLPRDPYERWRSFNLHRYTIDQARICYCPEGGQTMRITIRADTLASVTRLSDSSSISPPMSTYYLSVDSLFGIIRSSGTDSLVATYNETFGYPETLDINPQLHPVDGGVLYRSSNLHIP